MFEILTDTSSNLSFALLQKRNIGCIPLTFLVDGREQMCLSDTFDGEAYYDAIRAGAKVTTSQITPQRCIDAMRPLLEQGQDILYVGMSSGISGSFASAQMAAAELREAFPLQRIELVDTLSASLGEGLLVLYAADLRERGVSLEETAQALERRKYRMCQVFSVTTSSTCARRGGCRRSRRSSRPFCSSSRCSRATARARSSALPRCAVRAPSCPRWRGSMRAPSWTRSTRPSASRTRAAPSRRRHLPRYCGRRTRRRIFLPSATSP